MSEQNLLQVKTVIQKDGESVAKKVPERGAEVNERDCGRAVRNDSAEIVIDSIGIVIELQGD